MNEFTSFIFSGDVGMVMANEEEDDDDDGKVGVRDNWRAALEEEEEEAEDGGCWTPDDAFLAASLLKSTGVPWSKDDVLGVRTPREDVPPLLAPVGVMLATHCDGEVHSPLTLSAASLSHMAW